MARIYKGEKFGVTVIRRDPHPFIDETGELQYSVYLPHSPHEWTVVAGSSSREGVPLEEAFKELCVFIEEIMEAARALVMSARYVSPDTEDTEDTEDANGAEDVDGIDNLLMRLVSNPEALQEVLQEILDKETLNMVIHEYNGEDADES